MLVFLYLSITNRGISNCSRKYFISDTKGWDESPSGGVYQRANHVYYTPSHNSSSSGALFSSLTSWSLIILLCLINSLLDGSDYGIWRPPHRRFSGRLPKQHKSCAFLLVQTCSHVATGNSGLCSWSLLAPLSDEKAVAVPGWAQEGKQNWGALLRGWLVVWAPLLMQSS